MAEKGSDNTKPDSNPYSEIEIDLFDPKESLKSIVRLERIPQLLEIFADGGKADKIMTTMAGWGMEDPEAKTFLNLLGKASKLTEYLFTGVFALPEIIRFLNSATREAIADKMKSSFPELKRRMEANDHDTERFLQEHETLIEKDPYINEIVYNALREMLLGPKSSKIVGIDEKTIFLATKFLDDKLLFNNRSPEYSAFVDCRVAYLKEKYAAAYPDDEFAEAVNYIVGLPPVPVAPVGNNFFDNEFLTHNISVEEIALDLFHTNTKNAKERFFESSVNLKDLDDNPDLRSKIIGIKADELTNSLEIFGIPAPFIFPPIKEGLEMLYDAYRNGVPAAFPAPVPGTSEFYFNEFLLKFPSQKSLDYLLDVPSEVIKTRITSLLYDLGLPFDSEVARNNILNGILYLNAFDPVPAVALTPKDLLDNTATPEESFSILMERLGPLSNTLANINPNNAALVREFIDGDVDLTGKFNFLTFLDAFKANGIMVGIPTDISEIVKIYEGKTDATIKLKYEELETFGLILKYIENNPGMLIPANQTEFNEYKEAIRHAINQENLISLTANETRLNALAVRTPEQAQELIDIRAEIAKINGLVIPPPTVIAVYTNLATPLPPMVKTLDIGVVKVKDTVEGSMDRFTPIDRKTNKEILGEVKTSITKETIERSKKTREFFHNNTPTDMRVLEMYSVLDLPYNTDIAIVQKRFESLNENLKILEGFIANAPLMAKLMNYGSGLIGGNRLAYLMSSGFLSWAKNPSNQKKIEAIPRSSEEIWVGLNSEFVTIYDELSKILGPTDSTYFFKELDADKLNILVTYAAEKPRVEMNAKKMRSNYDRIEIVATDPAIKEIYDNQLMLVESEATLSRAVNPTALPTLRDPIRYAAAKAAFAAERVTIKDEIIRSRNIPKDEHEAMQIFLALVEEKITNLGNVSAIDIMQAA